MATVAAAFPFIEVRIDTSGLQPVAQRAPGVIAIVGNSDKGAAEANTPVRIETLADALTNFAAKDASGAVQRTPLYNSLEIAMLQDPKPSKIYGVKAQNSNYSAALASLEAADDVTFVSLANVTSVGAAASGSTAATGLMALKEHVENMSAQGQKRIGVAMVDPATAKSATYVSTVKTTVESLKSDTSRMVMIAARGANGDAASAAMAAIAAYPPHISMVLKKVVGFSMPLASQYSPSEIKGLSEANIIPVIDPALIPGESLHFAEGRTFTRDANLLYIDIVRTLDHISFSLQAGLIGLVGDARITKMGMTRLLGQVEGILGPLLADNMIAGFKVSIPVLDVLNAPESAWSQTDATVVRTARQNRTVDMYVSVTYGPAVHLLKVTLAPKF